MSNSSSEVAVCIVNLNCLQYTKNLIADLDRQTFSNFDVFFYDQNSSESGTGEFLDKLNYRKNYNVVINNGNVPLNHIWNDFASNNNNYRVLSFLNNDIRITSNYLEDTVNVLDRDKRIGIAIHATNNRDYSTATSPTRHIMESRNVKQGWEFSLRSESWKNIPEVLKFYCGDDFIFENNFRDGRKVGVITSSPVIHKLSKTRDAMGEEFTKKIKEQALLDIENYKKLGFDHHWNNIPKYSRMNQELSKITEISTEKNLCKFQQYGSRLNDHLNDSKRISGKILDIGLNDKDTFDSLFKFAVENDKHLIAIDSIEFVSGDIVNTGGSSRPSKSIIGHVNYKKNENYFTIKRNGILNDVSELNDKISFAFIGIFSVQKLTSILPKVWKIMEPGGTIFIPYYHYNSAPDVAKAINGFFDDKRGSVTFSRPQTRPGINDSYLAIKCHKHSVPFIKIKKPLIVASVLRTGGNIYNEKYVNKLASAIKRHLTKKYEFVCLTDSTKGINKSLAHTVPLKYGLHGWWSKMELFRPELFSDNQILYFDLDTLIVDNIDDFASYGGDFLGLRDFNTLTQLGSGVLSWQSKKTNNMYYDFMNNLINRSIELGQITDGDQRAIEMFLDLDIDWVQDLFPNKMAAFKYRCYNSSTGVVDIPQGTSVVCFHGSPKICEISHNPVIARHWK